MILEKVPGLHGPCIAIVGAAAQCQRCMHDVRRRPRRGIAGVSRALIDSLTGRSTHRRYAPTPSTSVEARTPTQHRNAGSMHRRPRRWRRRTRTSGIWRPATCRGSWPRTASRWRATASGAWSKWCSSSWRTPPATSRTSPSNGARSSANLAFTCVTLIADPDCQARFSALHAKGGCAIASCQCEQDECDWSTSCRLSRKGAVDVSS